MASPRAPKVQYVKDWFIYRGQALALAPAAVANVNITIQADSDFELVKLAQMSDIAAAAQLSSTLVIPLVTMQLVDGGSGRQLFSDPIPMGAIFGGQGLPYILPVPRIFKARSNIALTLTNYDAGVTYNLRFAFMGAKIFALGIP